MVIELRSTIDVLFIVTDMNMLYTSVTATIFDSNAESVSCKKCYRSLQYNVVTYSHADR